MKTGTLVLIGGLALTAGTVGIIMYRKKLPSEPSKNTRTQAVNTIPPNTASGNFTADKTNIAKIIDSSESKLPSYAATILNTTFLNNAPAPAPAVIKPTITRTGTTAVNTKTKQGAAMQGINTYNLLN